MIRLFKPYMPELPELESILYSGALAYGNYTKQFEQELKEYFGTPYLIVCGSYSDAVSVALGSLGIKPGDEVIASPMACLVSTQPYLTNGLSVRWADVDPKTGTLCPDSVLKQIRPNTKAIVHNHFCGYPGHIDEINRIGREKGLPVIDDGIECLGAEYKGRKIGVCGADAAVFSLSAVRFLNCIEGGIVIFKSKEAYEKSLLIRDCGIDRSRFRDELGEINPDCDISLAGYSAMMSNVNAYIGLQQLKQLDRLLSLHRKQASKWDDYFSQHPEYSPIVRRDCNPNYWVYGLLADNKTESIKKFRDMGYYASGVHMRNDRYSVFGRQDAELCGTEEFYNSFLALPCGWWMD